MEADQVKSLLVQYDIFDQTIVEHGFTQYMRDYRVVAESMAGGRLMPR